MKKKISLKKSSDFKIILKKGKRFISSNFSLYIRKNTLPISRLGVSISKGHFKLATRRNRLRRIAKELFRTEIIPHLKGYDFIVASRAGSSQSNINEVIDELRRLILKLKE